MVCIAAFIILTLIAGFVLIISLFKPELGKGYLRVFKKAWGCIAKRLTLQKCETSFKADIKNSLLKKVVIKKPKLVKPISFGIEVAAVIIVFITVFSLVEVVKGGLSLYVFGTCSVSNPNACIVGNTEICPIGGEEQRIGWFEEWRILFAGLPNRIKTWDPADYLGEDPIFYREFNPDQDIVLNIFDPLCHGCKASLSSQMAAGFFERYNVVLIPFSLGGEGIEHRYQNSRLITKFILATHRVPLNNDSSTAWQLLMRVFTGEYLPTITYQTAFSNEEISPSDVHRIIIGWLRTMGYTEDQIAQIADLVESEELQAQMATNERIIFDEINILGVPTTIYNGRKHTGVFRK